MELPKLKDQYTIWRQLPPPKYIVENLIIEGSINFIAAPSNAGKTLIATYLYLQLAHGGTFFDKKVEKQNILYLDLELQSNMFFLRLSKQYNKEIPDNLYYTDKKINIMDNDDLNRFIQILKENNIHTVIYDSYSQLTVGHEENSNSVQAEILSQLIKIKDHGLTQIFLHHTRKGTGDNNITLDSLRGGSVIVTGADSIFIQTKNNGIFRLKQWKDRLLPEDQWLDIFYKFQEIEGVLTPVSIEDSNINNSLSAQIIDTLKNTPYLSGNAITDKVHANRQKVTQELKKLVDLGAILQDPKDPRQGQRIKYYLPNIDKE